METEDRKISADIQTIQLKQEERGIEKEAKAGAESESWIELVSLYLCKGGFYFELSRMNERKKCMTYVRGVVPI